jgi:uncharacterized protein YigA (DUF484 family)
MVLYYKMENKLMTQDISSEDVLTYLRENPNFLKKNPEILEYVDTPKQNQGKGVADFQHYMVEKLKADRAAVMDTTRELVEISRNNMQNLTRVHQAVLHVIDCHTIEQFSQILTTEICNILDVDLAVFVFETTKTITPYINLPGIRLVPEHTIDGWMSGDTHLLESDIHGVEEIYGGGATLVRSQAIMRLDVTTTIPPSVIAFGSRDPEMFTAGQGIEMVEFLTRVIEKSLGRVLLID